MTGKFLTQGLRPPNYVYEPLSVFMDDLRDLTSRVGLKKASTHYSEPFREELMNVFRTGLPNENSFHPYWAKSGINVTNGGDVITKTIRLRFAHIRGWIENQESIKVCLIAILMMQQKYYKIISQIGLFPL